MTQQQLITLAEWANFYSTVADYRNKVCITEELPSSWMEGQRQQEVLFE
ncbi:hypothetical protein EGR_10944 [Echinococcus granulosus]|uniref:Uncharacterized protein n=1 Tax=Echinococcus granulosus TaxID=6210 RepID=W6TZF9_ECHGR|nr:hypothetical protein EGR_10944 [Echinococcus granulosus]EUB54200.1 hypothetical protein EGR_10944 [Echinococcus granulosus]